MANPAAKDPVTLDKSLTEKHPSFINAAYERYLGRSASKAEVQAWMKDPQDMGNVVNSIRDSEEAKYFEGRLLDVDDTGGGHSQHAWDQLVSKVYQNTLGRDATETEKKDYWNYIVSQRGQLNRADDKENLWHYVSQASANTEKWVKAHNADEFKAQDAKEKTPEEQRMIDARNVVWGLTSNIVYGTTENGEHLQRGQMFTLGEGGKAGNRSYDTGMRTAEGAVIYVKGDASGQGVFDFAPGWLTEVLSRGVTFGTRGKDYLTSKDFGNLMALTAGHLGDDLAGLAGGDDSRAAVRDRTNRGDTELFGDNTGKKIGDKAHQYAPAVLTAVASILTTPAGGAAVGAVLNTGGAASTAKGDVGRAALLSAVSLLGSPFGAVGSAALAAGTTKATGGSWNDAGKAATLAAASSAVNYYGGSAGYNWSPGTTGAVQGAAATGVALAYGDSLEEAAAQGVGKGVATAGSGYLQDYVQAGRDTRVDEQAKKDLVDLKITPDQYMAIVQRPINPEALRLRAPLKPAATTEYAPGPRPKR